MSVSGISGDNPVDLKVGDIKPADPVSGAKDLKPGDLSAQYLLPSMLMSSLTVLDAVFNPLQSELNNSEAGL